MSDPRTFVIVGAGLAGAAAAQELRRHGFGGRVLLVGAEPVPPYDRPPLSKEYLRGEQELSDVLVLPPDFFEEAEVEAMLGQTVERLEPASQAVEVAGGERISYDALLLATGGRNRRIPVPGRDLEGVYDLRTVDDADRIRAESLSGRRAVVVGMGFIGCEVAASLRQGGVEVAAVEPLSVPLGGTLGPEVGAALEALHRDHGVELHLGEAVERFVGTGRVEGVVTDRGRTLECDFAVVGVGIEPRDELARQAGLEVADGVVVDELCRTSAPGVYAAGDVARHLHPLVGEHVRVEHWQNARLQGEAAARNMLGMDEPYREVHWFWSDQYDRTVTYTGFHLPFDQRVVRGDPSEGAFTVLYLRDGRLLAAAALDRGRDVRAAGRLIAAGTQLSVDELADEEVDLRRLVRRD